MHFFYNIYSTHALCPKGWQRHLRYYETPAFYQNNSRILQKCIYFIACFIQPFQPLSRESKMVIFRATFLFSVYF
jgi:hypothetical protein